MYMALVSSGTDMSSAVLEDVCQSYTNNYTRPELLDQSGLELTEILLLLHPKNSD